MALKTPKHAPGRSGNAGRSRGSGAGPRQRRQLPQDLNLWLIPVTAAAGLISWVICFLLYSAMEDTVSRPLLIGILFFVFSIILILVVYVFSNHTGIFEENILTGGSPLSALLTAVGCAVIIGGAAVLFPWLYGLGIGKENTGPTSYIFVIDDSGSMANNDPEQKRYSAIASVLEDMPDDFPYMVYNFSNGTEIIKEMSTKSEGIPALSGNSYGGTSIRFALMQVMDDYENGIWDGGKNPRVILLTDGYATDIGLFSSVNKPLRRYARKGISVSTVGLGDVDRNLMQKIADKTGGVFIDVSDASGLAEAMNSAAGQVTDRDLLTLRNSSKLGWLYGILRVLFLLILGLMIGFAETVAYGFQRSVQTSLPFSAAGSFLGALFMKLGTELLGISDKIMWVVLWILTAVLVATKNARILRGQDRNIR